MPGEALVMQIPESRGIRGRTVLAVGGSGETVAAHTCSTSGQKEMRIRRSSATAAGLFSSEREGRIAVPHRTSQARFHRGVEINL